MKTPDGLEHHRRAGRALRGGPHSPRARPDRPPPPRAQRPPPGAAGGPAPPRGGPRRRRHPRLPARDRAHPRGRLLAGRPARARAGGPPRGDHRPHRQEDDDQRAELRRQGVAGRPRGRQHPAVDLRRRRPAQPARRHQPHHRLHRRRRQDLRAQAGRGAGHDHRAPPRLAPAREAHPRRRRGDLRLPGRLRALPRHRRAAPDREGPGPVLLPAEDGVPPRGAAVERRVQPRPGLPRHPARHHPGHRAHRDLPRRVRDGGDPLRAARALRGPERRALGLHVLASSSPSGPAARTSSCPTATR